MRSLDIDILDDGSYRLNKSYFYYSSRYNESVTLPMGMISDGATGPFIPDIMSFSWWVHDRICDYPYFDSGRGVKVIEASNILSDILKEEGRHVRAFIWRYATLLGCKRARRNGWF